MFSTVNSSSRKPLKSYLAWHFDPDFIIDQRDGFDHVDIVIGDADQDRLTRHLNQRQTLLGPQEMLVQNFDLSFLADDVFGFAIFLTTKMNSPAVTSQNKTPLPISRIPRRRRFRSLTPLLVCKTGNLIFGRLVFATVSALPSPAVSGSALLLLRNQLFRPVSSSCSSETVFGLLNVVHRSQPGHQRKQSKCTRENCPQHDLLLYFSCSTRSDGEIMSVKRTPNFSFTTTASPRATNLSLTSTSIGSPANLFSSMTLP